MSTSPSSPDLVSFSGSCTSLATSYFQPLASVQSFTDIHLGYGIPAEVNSEYVLTELNNAPPASSSVRSHYISLEPAVVSDYIAA